MRTNSYPKPFYATIRMLLGLSCIAAFIQFFASLELMINGQLEGPIFLVVFSFMGGCVFLIIGPLSIKSYVIENNTYLVVKTLFMFERKKIVLEEIKAIKVEQGMIAFGKQIEKLVITLKTGKIFTITDFDQTNYQQIKKIITGYNNGYK